MRGLESAIEWLRRLVDSKAWDYCVVWKLGDDPSRFIEWMDCCCSGGDDYKCGNVKEEIGKENHLACFCKDLYYKHPIKTKACEALAHFPSFMPLYSGIHGEAVISDQSRWLSNDNSLEFNHCHESVGTRVLIPVLGGLIELFASKHMEKDPKLEELIKIQCNVPIKQDVMIARCYSNLSPSKHGLDPLLEENLQNLAPPCHLLSFIPRIQFLPLLTQPNKHLSFEGSSSGSNPSNSHPSFDSNSGHFSQGGCLKQSIDESSGSRKSKYTEHVLKQQAGSYPDCNDRVAKAIQRPERHHYNSKNLVMERRRRNRIRDGLLTLRALVPKITKMDKASTLGDAIDYIVELQKEVKKLQDELKEIDEDVSKMSNTELNTSKSESLDEGSVYLAPIANNHGPSSFGEKKKTEVQLEVNQLGKRDFLIKLFCEQKRGGFGRLMDALNSLGLHVVDANITTFNGRVLNILKVEANKKDVQPKKLRQLLIELTGQFGQ